jgi:NAD(P)H dehydrogenase (quinone)
MNVFIVYWHPEPKSFNAAMFSTACKVLAETGAEVQTSDLHAMAFDPVSSRKNFQTVKDPDFFKLQLEEMYATKAHGFSSLLEGEMQKLEACELDDLAVPSMVVRPASRAEGLGGPGFRDGAHLWRWSYL